jgi:hypothetical protein
LGAEQGGDQFRDEPFSVLAYAGLFEEVEIPQCLMHHSAGKVIRFGLIAYLPQEMRT